MSQSFLAAVDERSADAGAQSTPSGLSLTVDVIRLIACACTGVEALAWCAACALHHDNRPPLRRLIIDDLKYFEEALDSVPMRASICCSEHAAYVDLLSQAVFADDADDGLRLLVRPMDLVHDLVGRIGARHASEITHLSLRMHLGYEDRHRKWEGHAALLTRLRVLEIFNSDPGSEIDFGAGNFSESFGENSSRRAARRALIESTRGSLQTLALIDTTGHLDVQLEIMPLLRLVGAHLHYLSICAIGCHTNISDETLTRGAVALQLDPRAFLEYDTADVDDDDLDNEMLRNAIEGLCVSLREPARVIRHFSNHVYAAGEAVFDIEWNTYGDAEEWFDQVRGALADPSWLI